MVKFVLAHAAESLESHLTTTHPVHHLYGLVLGTKRQPCPCCQRQHNSGCIPAGPCFQQAGSALGAHPLFKERGESPRLVGTQSSHGQPEEQEGPACVPGGWVMRDFAGRSQRDRSYHCLSHTNSSPEPHTGSACILGVPNELIIKLPN